MKLFQLLPKKLYDFACNLPPFWAAVPPARRTENRERRTERPYGATGEAAIQAA